MRLEPIPNSSDFNIHPVNVLAVSVGTFPGNSHFIRF